MACSPFLSKARLFAFVRRYNHEEFTSPNSVRSVSPSQFVLGFSNLGDTVANARLCPGQFWAACMFNTIDACAFLFDLYVFQVMNSVIFDHCHDHSVDNCVYNSSSFSEQPNLSFVTMFLPVNFVCSLKPIISDTILNNSDTNK